MKTGGNKAKKTAVLALLCALGLIAFTVEELLPPMVIPGAKPGLANIFSLTALIMYSPWEAFAVVAARTVLGSVFGGNPSALLYSFTGGTAALAVSSLLMCFAHPRVSVTAVSVAAAVTHNITQNFAFVLISGTALMWGYLPLLIVLGALSGGIVGIAVTLIFRGIPESAFEKLLGGKNTPCQ